MTDSGRIVEEFIRLAAFDSETGNEKEISDYLFKLLIDYGFEVERDSIGNIYGLLKGDTDRDPILFSSHMDTVSPGVGKKVIVHDDSRITSDGSTVLGADDISGLVSIIEAIRVIKEDGLDHGDIEVLFSVQEESFCSGSAGFDFSKIKAKQAYVLDLSGPIGGCALAAPSILTFTETVYGKSAHSGFDPERGIHAIFLAAKAIAEIKNGHIDENTTVNIGLINGGSAPNIVPDKVVVTGEIRSLSHKKALEQASLIEETFLKTVKDTGARVTHEVKVNFKAYRTDENSKTVKRFIRTCDRVGVNAVLQTTFGGSDNNRLAEHGIDGIVIACGMNNVHTTQEYTSVIDLTLSAEVTLALATDSE